jgi:hypothetical protein
MLKPCKSYAGNIKVVKESKPKFKAESEIKSTEWEF